MVRALVAWLVVMSVLHSKELSYNNLEQNSATTYDT